MRKRIAALLMVVGLAALLGAAPLAAAESQSLDIYPGQDLAAIVNGDSATTATSFYVHNQSGDPYTYNVSTILRLNTGDKLIGDTGTFIERGPAFDPQPTVNIVGSAGVSNVIRAEGTVHLEWVKIVGGTGQYSGGSPVSGTGSGLAMGKASDTSSLYAVHITGSDAMGISNARGSFDRIELDDTTRDSNFLGFTGAGLKATTEIEVRNSYVHDNQGNGLWCDEFCNDSASQPNGFWIHDNLLVNNGRAGIRYERVGDVSTAGEALIEHNEVHGNSPDANRGGISVRDAENATIQANTFGGATTASVSYGPNSRGIAIIASDSGRADRPNLFNIDILNNTLNGETIKGCELPDEVVACVEDTAPETTIDSGPASVVNSASASFSFSSSEAGSTFECSLDAAPLAECASPKEYAGLLDGEHTFEVRAINGLGTADPTPAKHTWTVDTVVPEAPTITSPEDNSHNNTGSVTLSGTAEPGSTIEIFEGTASKGTTRADASGAWSVMIKSVPDGSHTYTATATDAATNTSPPSNTRTVIVDVTQPDATAPTVTSTVPTANATGVAPTTNVTATFSEDMDASSINTKTFKFFKKGSSTKLPVAVSYDAGTDTATLDPTNSLQSGVTYKAVVSTGAKDLAGNPLDQNSTKTGSQQMAWFFTVS
jgi:hypothetical protein